MLYKNAAHEMSGVTDPVTKKPIAVSIKVRKLYRHWFRGQELGEGSYSRIDWSRMRNKQLNDVIAKDFAMSSDGVVHRFRCIHSTCNSEDPEWIEIRLVKASISGKKNPFNYFFSVIRDSSIDIITLTGGYKKPSAPRV